MRTPHHHFVRIQRFIMVPVTVLAMHVACGRPVENEPIPETNDPAAVAASATIALVGVRVITALGSMAAVQVPVDAVVIHGSGRYVMPALIDMHAHLASGDLDAYVNA